MDTMDATTGSLVSLACFLILLGISGLAGFAGWRLGVDNRGRAGRTAAMGLLLLGVWGWLRWHPEVAVHVMPVGWLQYLEGTATVPIFMLVLGAGGSQATLPRQRRLVVLAGVVGVLFFIQNGLWMVQAPPVQEAFADETGPTVLQSQYYSCVAASTATALNLVGVATTEAEMAYLTSTRTGTGATMFRAMEGMRRKVAGRGYRVELLQPSYQDLQTLPMPLLTPLRFDMVSLYSHMVVLLEVTEQGVLIFDPQFGVYHLLRPEFERAYEGHVLALRVEP